MTKPGALKDNRSMPCRTYKNVTARDSDGNETVWDIHAYEGYQIHPCWLLLIPVLLTGLASLAWHLLHR